MNCRNCGAPMKLMRDRDYFVCDYCSTFYLPDESLDGVRTLEEPIDLICPVCGNRLVSASVDETKILQCSNCRGILLHQRIFPTIVKNLRARTPAVEHEPRPIHPKELERRIRCPYCNRWMDTHPYYGPGHVVIDNCENCNVIWLDYGELYKMITDSGRDREPEP